MDTNYKFILMRYYIKIIISKRNIMFFCFLMKFSLNSYAQIGNEFWFAAPDLQVAHGDDPIIMRFSAFEEDAKITITQPGNIGFKKIEINVKANTSKSIDLTYLKDVIECNIINKVQNKALLIKSTCKISCYYDIADMYNGDIFTLKGENALGLKFTIPQQTSHGSYGYPAYSSTFTILATENNTKITVNPTKDLEGYLNAKEIIINLNRGETYTFQNISYLPNQRAGGTIVKSNKPIAITIKDDSIQLPGYSCADTAGDQLIPDDLAGNEFIIMRGYFYIEDRYYIYPLTDSTKIYINGILKDTLVLGEYYEGFLSENSCYVKTNFPVQIFQLSGFGCEIGGGILPGITCTGSNAVNVARATQQEFFINLITKKENIANFTFNGLSNIITSADFEEVKGTDGNWMISRKEIPLNLIDQGESCNVANTKGLFHLGIIHGDRGSTTRFGYFSNFSNSVIKFENILETDCEVNKSICYGSSISLKPIIDSTVTYRWEGPNNFQSNNLILDIKEFSEEDAGYYTLTVNVGVCGTTKKRIFVSNPEINPLKAEFQINKDSQCLARNQFEFIDQSISLNGSKIIKKEWYISDVKKNNAEITNYTFKDTGSYSITLLIQDENKCIDKVQKSVIILPTPDIKISLLGKSKFCEGDSTLVTINSIEGNSSNKIKWFKDNKFLLDTSDNKLLIRSSGNYLVEVTNEYLCKSISDNIPIEVFANPSLIVNKPITEYICDSIPLTLNANSNGLVYWYLNDIRISGYVGNQLKVVKGGIYKAQAISVNGCIVSSVEQIKLENINIPKPIFNFKNSCIRDSVLFQNQTKDNNQPKYLWTFGNGKTSSETSPIQLFEKAGVYDVTLEVKIGQCPNLSQKKSAQIKIEEPIKGIRYPVISVSRDLPQILNARKLGAEYIWRPRIGLSAHDISNPIFDSKQNRDYLIDIKTASNCKFTDTLQVYVFDGIDILVPKAFTPNGDGVNDKLEFFPIGITEFIVFRVFNRWGQLLFETFDETNFWDGTYNGVLQPIDSYVWIAEGVSNKSEYLVSKRGQVILIK